MSSPEDRLKLIADNLKWLSENSTRLDKPEQDRIKNISKEFGLFNESMNEEVGFDEPTTQSKEIMQLDANSDSERI